MNYFEDLACAWAEYRNEYGVRDTTTAYKAFVAGWEAERAGQGLDVEALISARMEQVARAENAEAAIERVRELHHSKLDRHPQGDVQRCIACLDLWPCPTIRAIEGGSDE